MSTLRYRDGADIEDLALDECVVRHCDDQAGDYLRLWFRVLARDGSERTFSVPVAPSHGPFESPRRTWGLGRTSPGVWQVSPSINVLKSLDIHQGPHPDESLWHETPAIEGVPDPAPWSAP